MIDNSISRLVILAGGQSRRMGQDKALLDFRGKRMIDHVVDRLRDSAGQMILSASQDYGTGLELVPDQSSAPRGPVGAIFTLSHYLTENDPAIAGFVTAPVDAPFAPKDLVTRLSKQGSCAVAGTAGQLHPTFAYWRCKDVESVKDSFEPAEKAPSLHWLTRQCMAKVVEWEDASAFANINTPEDLISFSNQK